MDLLRHRAQASPRAALAVLSLGMLMIILDGTIVSVALPAIRTDLGVTPVGLAWTVNAYLVPLGGLLLLAGRLGDLYGRRRMLLAGLSLFALASLACGLASGPALLIGARFVQGVGAAMGSAVILGMIVGLFPDARERARAMGVYAFVGAAGASLGLLLGGVLTETVGWRWIFLVNVPVGIVAVLLVLRTIARDGTRDRTVHPDVLGGVLVTLGLMVGVYAIVESSGPRLALATAAVALLLAFVVRQRHATQPLVPLGVFRSRSVSTGNVVQLLIVAGMLGFQFVAALYLQQVLGYGAAATGFAMVPIPVVIAAVSLLVAGRVIGRVGPRPVLLAGEILLVAGLLLLARPAAGVYLTDVLPALVLLGVGAGLTLPAVTTVIMSDATPATAGLASGLANTSQQVGGALGTAVLATLAAARTDAVLGADPVAALGEGYRLAFAAGGVLVAVATVLTLTLPRRAIRP